jgi:adenylate cyclase class IV
MTAEIRKEYKVVYSKDKKNSNEIFNIRSKLKTLYPPRKIDSLYMDTIDFRIYKDSKFNDINKFKLRFRQYDKKSTIQREIKKNTELGRKKNIETTNYESLDDIQPLNFKSMSLVPVVKISFLREYYYTKNLRVTIDTDLVAKLSSFVDLNQSIFFSDKNIVEFKLKNTQYKNNFLSKVTINQELSIEDRIHLIPVSFSKYTHAVENLIKRSNF